MVQKSRSSNDPSPRPRLLDARPDRLDLRDRPWQPPLRSLPPRYPDDRELARLLPAYVRAGLILDQGSEGACTGFGLACVANHLLWLRHTQEQHPAAFEPVSPRMLYELARRYDEWPGEDYDGSSCRGALKGWHKHGVCSERLWPYPLDAAGKPRFVSPAEGWDQDAGRRTIGVYYRIDKDSVTDLQAAIATIGAVYVSAQVHDGWQALARRRALAPPRDHRSLERQLIAPVTDPKSLGGHAFALVGYNERGFVVQNSWGTGWGAAGFALLPYADWVTHGSDAWACALGVPVAPGEQRLSSRRPVGSGRGLATQTRAARAAGNRADDPWPLDREFLHQGYRPCSTDQAYDHTLVTGNDGLLRVSDFTHDPGDAAGYARRLVHDGPLAWAGDRRTEPLKLAIYAHGGLNGESEAIARARLLAPCFLANGIYPLFLAWRTGFAETLGHMAVDWWRQIAGTEAGRSGGFAEELRQATDRALEAVARRFGRGIWSEMRENARLAMDAGRGVDLLAGNLVALRASLGRKRQLEVHLIGHSAGSILLGHLIERLGRGDLRPTAPAVASCSLYAAACSMVFAVERYLGTPDLLAPADLWLYNLSDANEKRDGLPDPSRRLYGKSLLYLVSRALDDARKMPLLGFERAVAPGHERDAAQWATEQLPWIQAWQQGWSGGHLRIIDSPTVPTNRSGGRSPASHGSFDNNLDVIGETLERIRGRPLVAPLEWLGP